MRSTIVNDFVVHVGTVNGSGSQSANNILVKSLFRMGLPVGGKNLFPSNIAGLPTWFTIRVHPQGFTSRRAPFDIVVAANEGTFSEDIRSVKSGGILFYNSEFRLDPKTLRTDIETVAIPFRSLSEKLSESVRLKKMLQNVLYVGVLAELLGIDQTVLESVIQDQFGDKAAVIASNLQAIHVGREFAEQSLSQLTFPYKVAALPGGNEGHILIDGNSSAALGCLFGGCTFVAWYPITPSSSLVETFEGYAKKLRQTADGKNTFAVVQAEDELASICMVAGAGWAGARAMTATSGPGLSLMSEAAGLCYYAEIPAVIWDVQRVGPSTGLPTRTMQGDLSSAYTLSHGDTKHVVLLPANPTECFEFGQIAFDLAERLQTLVIVLSDLDLGMNFHRAKEFAYPDKPFDRGKVLNAAALESAQSFARYKDTDGDGIGPRTLPGTEHPLAGYFTRGTGHDEKALYSENAEVYRANMDRLVRKFETAKKLVPPPVVEISASAKVGLLAFGSTDFAISEIRTLLQDAGVSTSYLRPRALPLGQYVEDFARHCDRVYVLEQNRDAQLLSILRAEFPALSNKILSVVQYNGEPAEPAMFVREILKSESANRGLK